MTKPDFQNGLNDLNNHLFQLDEASRSLVDDLFDMFKKLKRPFGYKIWSYWIEQENEWYFVEAYLPQGGKIVVVDQNVAVKEPDSKEPQEDTAKFYDGTAVLRELVKATEQTIEKVLKGEYADWLSENLPLTYRTGMIRLKDVSEKSRALMVGEGTNLTDGEKEEFLSYKETRYVLFMDQISVWDMTAKQYFGMYACVGRECGLQGAETLSDKELFFRYYAGDSESDLEEIDENDPVEFSSWYNRRKAGGNVYYSFCGNRNLPAAIELCQDEVGYFAKLYSCVPEGNALMVRFYNALVRAGYPVYIENSLELLAWLNEDYRIAVYPEKSSGASRMLRANNCMHAFVRYRDLPNEELKNAVDWFEEEELYPADERK